MTTEQYGIRFSVHDPKRFASLSRLFDELKKAKAAYEPVDPRILKDHLPDDVKSNFIWSPEQSADWQNSGFPRGIITEPADQSGAKWGFNHVCDTIERGEYELISCSLVKTEIGEILIDPFSHPYGGMGPFTALVEAFGFRILGVNEYGEYLSREELTNLIANTYAAFSTYIKPTHSTDYQHCDECAEYDRMLEAVRSQDLSIQQIGTISWGPVPFLTPEAMAYYVPRLIELAVRGVNEKDGDPFFTKFNIYVHSGPTDKQFERFGKPQITAVASALAFIKKYYWKRVLWECSEGDFEESLVKWSV